MLLAINYRRYQQIHRPYKYYDCLNKEDNRLGRVCITDIYDGD